MLENAYELGWDACTCGMKDDMNPYSIFFELEMFYEWRKGYYDALSKLT